ncbi:hypothetical protein SERLA73DRAFT_185544 [Serpula lacrymans var. lacrymans S7.3]|uniref:Uncharacterized protein n=2 Tax=Serpula lacrymans var. lacrymans TaxID=341189 RepID=F8Q610_SERL3|nr:uncharacterized protein SERLADRAFT_474071 [Serpula lacrymans var. lacrymans S7.9]EGN96048.1 hypothetical protein SERLA73DRAFT_185544 [Serpula lacrymans var. lacrymans S7.3]EGO21570.1 hypothetical protein SERLADRAFT_474071 [Serpula lacrymans var. lacrymans S7.9]
MAHCYKSTKGQASRRFRDALGLSSSKEDEKKFADIKLVLRLLAYEHFEIGIKPTHQGEQRWEMFYQRVMEVLPIFNSLASRRLPHMRIYIHKVLAQAAFHQRKRTAAEESTCTPAILATSNEDNKDRDSCRMNLKTTQPGPPRVTQTRATNVLRSLEDQRPRSTTALVLASGSLSQTQPAQSSFSQETTHTTKGVTSLSRFLAKANPNMEYLIPIFLSVGITNQECLDALVTWPKFELVEFLRGLVSDGRLTRFEGKVIEMLFREVTESSSSSKI